MPTGEHITEKSLKEQDIGKFSKTLKVGDKPTISKLLSSIHVDSKSRVIMYYKWGGGEGAGKLNSVIFHHIATYLHAYYRVL